MRLPAALLLLAMLARFAPAIDPVSVVAADETPPRDEQAATPSPDPNWAPNPALEAALKKLNLPGLTINLRERCVDMEATVCLDKGLLELVACTRGTKEHESIVAIEARPMHVHTALLLLGAEAGNPALRQPPEHGDGPWIDIPPRGASVGVSLLFKNGKGELAEHPISEFITHAASEAGAAADKAEAPSDREFRFPTDTFLFTGSRLVGDGPGPREYLSDTSGNVISIVTYGDELLGLPEVKSSQNTELVWRINATGLPAPRSKVTLRLRPRPRPDRGDAIDLEKHPPTETESKP